MKSEKFNIKINSEVHNEFCDLLVENFNNPSGI